MMIFLNCKLILWPVSLVDQATLSLKTFETGNENLYFLLNYLIFLHVLKLHKVQIKPVFLLS